MVTVIRLLTLTLLLYIVFQFVAASTVVFAQNPAPPCDEQAGTCPTDIGPIPLDAGGFVMALLKYAVGFGGGLALLLIIWGGFRIITSNGNTEEVSKGKEIITYAIVGLILILFAVVIVKVIGVGILQLPFFG